jgi:hypothetical protein
VPELSAGLEADRNLSDGARRLAHKLAEIICRENRAGRFMRIPEHSDSRSDNIRTRIPGYPDTLAVAAGR